MAYVQEFKEFILRGKVVDLAVGVAVGGAFTKVIDTFVKEIVLPIAGYFGGGINFAEFKWVLQAADKMRGITEVSVAYGLFINAILSFLLIGAVVFAFIKLINRLHKTEEKNDFKKSEELLSEIRDLLAKKI